MSDQTTTTPPFDPSVLTGYLLRQVLDVNSGSVVLATEDGERNEIVCGVISLEVRNSETQQIEQFNLTIPAESLIALDTAIFAAGVEVGIALGSQHQPEVEAEPNSGLILPTPSPLSLVKN